MSNIINYPTIIAALQDLARGVKSEKDLGALAQDLLKINRAIGCTDDRRRIVRVIRLHNINSESFAFPGSAWE